MASTSEMSKVAFNNEGSVLREWEQMHRPPENVRIQGIFLRNRSDRVSFADSHLGTVVQGPAGRPHRAPGQGGLRSP